jgi:uncharacterized metal-binding protein YceD (DUF177 family)
MPESADQGPLTAPRLRVASLRQSGPTPVHLAPSSKERAAIATELDALALRKLRFDGSLFPRGKAGWRLEAKLGATVIQACIVTLEPVTTRIDIPVVRDFIPEERQDELEAGSEIEMPEDDTSEYLGDEIDMIAVMTEALSLAMPSYPRKDGVELGEARFAEDGVTPMTEEDAKPFAGLAALRDKMNDDGDKG